MTASYKTKKERLSGITGNAAPSDFSKKPRVDKMLSHAAPDDLGIRVILCQRNQYQLPGV